MITSTESFKKEGGKISRFLVFLLLARSVGAMDTLQKLAVDSVVRTYTSNPLTLESIRSLIDKKSTLSDDIAQKIIEMFPLGIPLIKAVFDSPRLELLTSLSRQNTKLKDVLTHDLDSCDISSSGRYVIVTQYYGRCREYGGDHEDFFSSRRCDLAHPNEYIFFLVDLKESEIYPGVAFPPELKVWGFNKCSFSPDDTYFFVATPFHFFVFETTAFIEDKETAEIGRFAFDKSISSIAFDNSGITIYVSSGASISKIDLITKSRSILYERQEGHFDKIVAHPDGRFLISSFYSRNPGYFILIFSLETNQIIKVFRSFKKDPNFNEKEPSLMGSLDFHEMDMCEQFGIDGLYTDSSGQTVFVKKGGQCFSFDWREAIHKDPEQDPEKSGCFDGVIVSHLPTLLEGKRDPKNNLSSFEHPTPHDSIITTNAVQLLLTDFSSGQIFGRSKPFETGYQISRSKNEEYIIVVDKDAIRLFHVAKHKISLPTLLLLLYFCQVTDFAKKAAPPVTAGSLLHKLLSDLDKYDNQRLVECFKLSVK